MNKSALLLVTVLGFGCANQNPQNDGGAGSSNEGGAPGSGGDESGGGSGDGGTSSGGASNSGGSTGTGGPSSGGSTGTGGSTSGGSGGSSSSGPAITATLNGEEYSIPSALALSFEVEGELRTQITGNASIDGGTVTFGIAFPGDEPGSFSCVFEQDIPQVLFQRLDGESNQSGVTVGEDDSCEIDVTEVDDKVVGSFSAHIENVTGTADIDGTFAVDLINGG